MKGKILHVEAHQQGQKKTYRATIEFDAPEAEGAKDEKSAHDLAQKKAAFDKAALALKGREVEVA